MPSDAFDAYISQEPAVPASIKMDAFDSYVGQENDTPDAYAGYVPEERPRKPRGALKEGARQLGLTARYGIEGAMALPAFASEAIRLPINMGIESVNELTGSNISPLPEQNQAISNALTQAGLPRPETRTERIFGDMTRGVAGAGTGIGIGSTLANASSPVAQGVGNVMASNPAMQGGSAVTGMGASGYVREGGGSPGEQFAAGILGAMAPSVAVGGYNSAKNLLTGGGIRSDVANLAKVAEDKYEIPISGAKISNSPFIKHLDSLLSKLPLTGNLEKDEAARTAFTKAVAKTFGEEADNLSPEVMSQAKDRIGKVFNEVAKNSAIDIDDDLVRGINQIADDAQLSVAESEYRPIANQIKNIFSKIKDGKITGDVYQALTRRNGPLDRAMASSDSNIRFYANQLRDTLDDGLERSATPETIDALRTARLQWKNMRTVQDLAAKAGIEGEINPAALLGAVKKSYKNMAYTGAGDIGELAQIGQRFLKEPPSSGTAERIAALKTLGLPATLAGGAAMTGDMETAGALLAATGALGVSGRAASSALNSQWYKNRLLQSAFENGAALDAAESPLSNIILNSLGRSYSPISAVNTNRLAQPAP